MQEGKIDYERIRAARKRWVTDIEHDESKAQAHRKVEVTLIQNFYKEAKIRQFTVYSDEPEDIGGSNKAPRPTEYMLASLGYCLMSILAVHASTMRITVDSLKLVLQGFRDDRGLLGLKDQRPGFHRIEVEWNVESKEPPERITKLIRMVEERCPVTDMIVNPTPVSRKVLLNSQTIEV